MEVFGLLLIRAIYDERMIYVPLAPSAFKYFFGGNVTLRDLEVYDPEEHISCQQLLALPEAQLLNLELFDLAVTDENKHEYVDFKVTIVLRNSYF